MTDMTDVLKLIDAQGAELKTWQEKHDSRLDEIAAEAREAALKAARPGGMGGGNAPTAPAQTWIDTKTRTRVPVLRPTDSLAALESKADKIPTMGRVLRGLVLGGAADDARELEAERKALSIGNDVGGGFTVAGVLSSQWIDLLRSQMVLTRAGALTVPMDAATLTLARLTGDPAVSWHAENAALDAVEATFGSMTLSVCIVVCMVRMSLELSQDSANIEDILQSSLVNAMAGAIDSSGLVGVVPAPGGVFDMAGRNTVTAIGAPTSWDFVVDGLYELMADGVPQESIGALIAHPALWRKMRKLKTGITSDNTPLAAPAEVAALPKLWTTAAPLTSGTTAKAVLGRWSDLLFGVRKSITIKVLSEAFLGSNLQVAVLAYARVDFGATRQQSFCTMEGITVA